MKFFFIENFIEYIYNFYRRVVCVLLFLEYHKDEVTDFNYKIIKIWMLYFTQFITSLLTIAHIQMYGSISARAENIVSYGFRFGKLFLSFTILGHIK